MFQFGFLLVDEVVLVVVVVLVDDTDIDGSILLKWEAWLGCLGMNAAWTKVDDDDDDGVEEQVSKTKEMADKKDMFVFE